MSNRKESNPDPDFPKPPAPLSPPKLEGEIEVSEQKQKQRQYRVLRVLEYTGSLEWVTDQIERRSVKGRKTFKSQEGEVCSIQEAVIGETAEWLPGWEVGK